MANRLVIPGPALLDLPISNHGDFYAKFVYKPVVVDVNGEPILDDQGKYQFAVEDYPAGSSVALHIDTETPIIVDSNDPPTPEGSYAVITDQFAEVLIDKIITAAIVGSPTWSLVLTFASGFDKPIMEGRVKLTQKMASK